ncbi:MAG: 2-amino-4-hydroxy-6-hydroxymethyldihydropteridine diphosphokinase [Thermonemataceae bacterium]|nr:2-amino-4-hydroxy-6-hydroxymethyldihydropteridine diphosphokinase [Thermonemataceae bacterium]
MEISYILLGTNLGDRNQNLQTALTHIEKIGEVISKSSIYESEPWGVQNQQNFLNMVIELQINFNPQELLSELLAIEKKMGRERKQKWEARLIDLDILYFKNLIINELDLVIPHPFLQERRFTLEPLCEIAPMMLHPILSKTNAELLEICPDKLFVSKLGELTKL